MYVYIYICMYTLRLSNMVTKNPPKIDDFPLKPPLHWILKRNLGDPIPLKKEISQEMALQRMLGEIGVPK